MAVPENNPVTWRDESIRLTLHHFVQTKQGSVSLRVLAIWVSAYGMGPLVKAFKQRGGSDLGRILKKMLHMHKLVEWETGLS